LIALVVIVSCQSFINQLSTRQPLFAAAATVASAGRISVCVAETATTKRQTLEFETYDTR